MVPSGWGNFMLTFSIELFEDGRVVLTPTTPMDVHVTDDFVYEGEWQFELETKRGAFPIKGILVVS